MASYEGNDIGGASQRAVTAFFDDGTAAQAAVDDLVSAGVARERIALVEGQARPVATEPVATDEKSLWDTVKDLFMADEDRHAYGEGLRRGGVLLSVTTGAADHDRVVEILDREGAVDMDARQSDWELEGWNPARASADLAASRDLSRAEPAVTPSDAPATATPADGLRSAFEPSAPVGPAFGAGGAGRGSGRHVGRSVVRDSEAEGLRLRTYVASRTPPDTAG